jgi:hypothetical protein
LNKIVYSSDESAAQYKNRENFLNVILHEDFGVPAEWHFFAISHGKSACDALGGAVNRLAAKASLQEPHTDETMTPRQLFNWAQINIKNMNFLFVTELEFMEEEIYLKSIQQLNQCMELLSFVLLCHYEKVN